MRELVIPDQRELEQPRTDDACPILQSGIVYAAAWRSPDERVETNFKVCRASENTWY